MAVGYQDLVGLMQKLKGALPGSMPSQEAPDLGGVNQSVAGNGLTMRPSGGQTGSPGPFVNMQPEGPKGPVSPPMQPPARSGSGLAPGQGGGGPGNKLIPLRGGGSVEVTPEQLDILNGSMGPGAKFELEKKLGLR